MEIIAPFSKVFEWTPTLTSIMAVLLGFGFGFSLERAGFGSARTLAGVWYGYDMAVVRVMFTAVVVAMLGLFGLYYLGVLELDLVYVNPTYLWPQVVGGFIFGMGFNIGAYCPGTSLVAMATGKIDGLVFLLGFGVGVLGFAWSFPYIQDFYTSSYMGRLMLPDVLGLPPGVVVLLVVFLAFGAFALTHFVDSKMGNGQGQEQP